MSTIPTILTFDWVKVMVRLITAYWVAFTLLVIGGLVVTLFRRRFLYGKFRYELTRPGTWNPTLSLGDFVDELLMQPCSRKQKISHDVVNDIYLTRFEDESIGIKKMKETTLMFRIFLQVVTRGPRWFIRHTVLERSITLAQCKTGVTERAAEDGGILFEQNHVQVLIGSTRPGFEDLNAKLLDAILLNVPECKIKAAGKSNDLRRAVFKRLLKPIVQFVRGAGYLYSRRLVAKETDWANRTFFQTVVAIGSTLDPAIFRIRIRLAQTSPNLSLPIPKPDLVIVEYRSSAFNKVEQTAKTQLKAAKQKLRVAKTRLQLQLQKVSSDPQDPFLKSETLIDSLAEESIAEAQSPEVFARDSDVAQILLKSLSALAGIRLKEALEHPLVICCNKFIKASSEKTLSKYYQPLQSYVTAIKLGLCPTHFPPNGGFEEFAKKSHLHRYLYVQGHQLEVDTLNQIHILFEGELLPWKEVRPKLRFNRETGAFLGQYSRVGLVNYGVYEWEELKPFYIEERLPPPWGNRYLCEICSWIIDKPRVQGDHTFLRLKSPKGEWYSVGQYVLTKLEHDRYGYPLSVKPSRLMSPDVSEYWNGSFTTLAFEITPQQFALMKEKIERDKQQQLRPYQVYENNCTIWAKSIVELAGLDLPSSLNAADILAPNLTAFGRKINGMWFTPKWAKPLAKFGWAVGMNCLSLVFGSGMVHPSIKSDPNFTLVDPYIHSLKDLFDTNKVISHHPFVIGNHIRHQVEEWREAKKWGLHTTKNQLLSQLASAHPTDRERIAAKLTEVDLALDSVQYAIPDRFKIPGGVVPKPSPHPSNSHTSTTCK